jgi:hypothetical protein
MSGTDLFLAGAGNGMTDLARGTGQLLGLVDQQSIKEAADRDRALVGTTAGKAGDFVGSMAALLPAAFVPGTNTLAGSAAIGGLTGLLTPVAEGSVGWGKAKSAGLGAAIAPVAILAGRGAHSALNGAKALVEPFRAGGQKAIAGRILNRFATQADDAARIAGAATAPVPGYQLTLAEATKDPGLATLQRALANTDASARIGAVDASNAAVLKGLLSDMAGDNLTMTAARGARESATQALYEQADNVIVPLDEELQALFKRPVIAAAVETAKTNAKNRGETLLIDVAEDVTAVDGRSLHAIKKGIDDAVGELKPNSDTLKAAQAARDEFLEAIEDRLATYRPARETFKAMSRPINQMEVAGVLRDKLAPALDDFGETGGLRSGLFAQALRDPKLVKKATGMRGLLSDVMEPAQLDAIEGVGRALAGRAAAGNLARPVGTNTVQNLSAQNLMRQIAGPLGLPESFMDARVWPTLLRPVNYAYQAQEPALNTLLGSAITDPRLAARLMSMGVPKEHLGEVLQQIARYGVLPAALSSVDAAQQ